MKKLRIGVVGLGRLGKVHAQNIAYKIPNAELTAACSIMPAELQGDGGAQLYHGRAAGGAEPRRPDAVQRPR